jgi:hypothetical protein
VKPDRCAVGQSQPQKVGEAGELGESRRGLELGERLFVASFVIEMRAAVRPDSNQLQDVVRPFSVIQGQTVVPVPLSPIALQRRGEHRKHCVNGCESLWVGGDLRRLARPRHCISAVLRVSFCPVRGRVPREKKRLVPGSRAFDSSPGVDHERLIDVGSKIVQQAHPPSEPR